MPSLSRSRTRRRFRGAVRRALCWRVPRRATDSSSAVPGMSSRRNGDTRTQLRGRATQTSAGGLAGHPHVAIRPTDLRQIDVVGPTGQPRCGTFDHCSVADSPRRHTDVFVRRTRRRTRCAANTSATRATGSVNVPSQWAAQSFNKLTDLHYYCAMTRTVTGSAQAPRGGRLPDFLLVGAPKAGTTALHAALAQHPELFLSSPKEPKYYLCGDSPPPAYRGPGDAHSNREWIWQRQRYLDLFGKAGEGQQTGESTPFYLYHRDARRRISTDLPSARLVAVLRDPVDRAYSNWMHLWADGLEPCGDVVQGLRQGGRPHRGRMGAVLALPRPRHVRTTAGGPLRALPPRAGAGAALPAAGGRAAPDAEQGLPVPRGLAGRRHLDPGRQLTSLRAPERAHPAAGPTGAGRGIRGAVPAAFVPGGS